MKKKYYDGFIVHDILYKHLEPKKMLEVLTAFAEAKGVDAVEVIRCKDCIYWKEYCRIVDGVTSKHVCSRKREIDGLMHRAKADDFCSWAERKE